MADQIKKFLAKLSKKELENVQALLLDITNQELKHLDIKPLKGYKDFYRVRKGDIRIIFTDKAGAIKIISIGRRDDRTYSKF